MKRGNGVVLGLVLALGLTSVSAEARDYYRDRERRKLSVFLKGGVGNYTGGLGTYTQAGPTWGLTLDVQPLRMLGFEVGYDGGFNNVLSSSSNFGLIRHGGSGLLKLSLPFVEAVKPFVGLGVGASYIQVGSASSTAYSSGLLAEVPLVAGVEFNAEAFTAGLRATYRVLVNQQVYEPRSAPAGFFDIAITLGLRF